MLSDQNKAALGRENHSIAFAFERHGYFYGTIHASAMNRLLDAVREEGRQSAGERIKALEKALKPFAVEAEQWAYNVPNEFVPETGEPDGPAGDAKFTVGDLRRAASLLSPQAAPVEQGAALGPEDNLWEGDHG